jgi:hypothetical protein
MTLLADVVVALALVAVAAIAAVSIAKVRRVNRRFQVLEEIVHVAESGASLEETLDAIAAILVPEIGDFCTVDLIENGKVRRAAVRVVGPGAEAAEAGLAARKPALQEQMASAAARRRQEPRAFEYVTDEDLRKIAADEEDFEFLRGLAIRSGITVELRARGRAMGMLTVGVRRPRRRYRRGDIEFAGILAGRVALALDNAGLFSELERSDRERAEIAETLQRGLLPPPLPHIPGWSVAAMYRPAGAENEIGGDFYDAFRIAGGWMVVIGDVTGRGAHAAAVTAHARYTLRTAAALTGDPVVALRTLNRELLARSGTPLCSVAAMTITEDPSEPVRLAIAGHPPPLLVDGDSVREASSPAPVLGAFADEDWRIEETAVAHGQQLVVITDGITEAPGKDGRFGEARLRGCRAPPSPRSRSRARCTSSPAGRWRTTRRSSPSALPPRTSSRPPRRSASWSNGSTPPSTAATSTRSSPSATSGWSSSRSGPRSRSAARLPTSAPRACTSTCSTSRKPGTSS